MELLLLRHGKTQGNIERRYIGATDEPLCAKGEAELAQMCALGCYPKVRHAYISPLCRCRRTCELIYPNVPQTVVNNLREQAFGLFENKSYDELQFLPSYRNWLETAGESGIPQGESAVDFCIRCRSAFCTCVEDALARKLNSAVIVAHGGVLMAILSEYGKPTRNFYDWQAKNGSGFLVCIEPETWAAAHIVELVHEIRVVE